MAEFTVGDVLLIEVGGQKRPVAVIGRTDHGYALACQVTTIKHGNNDATAITIIHDNGEKQRAYAHAMRILMVDTSHSPKIGTVASGEGNQLRNEVSLGLLR